MRKICRVCWELGMYNTDEVFCFVFWLLERLNPIDQIVNVLSKDHKQKLEEGWSAGCIDCKPKEWLNPTI